MKSYKTTIVILFLLIYAQNLFSQEIANDTIPKTVINLNEVVLSVNKSEDTKGKIAQQVQILDAKEIAATQSQTTADVLASTGNVFIQKSQLGGGSVTLRGFEANRTLLVIDGVRMNNLIYRSGHLQNIVTIDNNSLDRIEILFGPSSTVYGSDALGGVVHLYTKKPLLAFGEQQSNIQVNVMSRYSSVDNELTSHLDFNIGTRKFASLTAFTFSKFDDLKGGANQNPFYEGSYGERPYYVERINDKDSLIKNADRFLQVQSGYSQWDILQKFLYQQNDHVSHGLNIQYSNSSDVPRYDRLTDPAGSGLKYAEWYYGPQARLLTAYDLNIKHRESGFQNIHLGVNYQNIEESRHNRKFDSDDLSHRTEKVNIMGVNLDFQKNLKQHTIRFGLDGQINSLKSKANSENISTGEQKPLDTRYPDGDNSMMNLAAYISHTWQINDQLSLVDGIRGGYITLHSTFVDTTFFDFPYKEANQSNPVVSGNIGLINTISDDWKLSILFSTGFRAPNVDDLSKVFESSAGTLVVPNPDLKPEKTFNTEIGITKIIHQKTQWENVVYYTVLKDAIVTDAYTYNGQDSIFYDGTWSEVQANQNKQQAYIYGFSSNLRSRCSENFMLNMAFNYTYGRIKTDSSDVPLDHIPPVMARLGLTYLNKNFSSDFYVNFNGAKNLKNYYLNGEDNEQYATPEGMPAWMTLNLHISYKVHKLLTIQAGVDNMFDTQYRTFASGINAPGRNIFAAVRFHY